MVVVGTEAAVVEAVEIAVAVIVELGAVVEEDLTDSILTALIWIGLGSGP